MPRIGRWTMLGILLTTGFAMLLFTDWGFMTRAVVRFAVWSALSATRDLG